MKFRSLPPAGNAISTKKLTRSPDDLFNSVQATWVDSGTSALALVLLDIKSRHPNVLNPEVLIPGYCCPDLLSAAIYAGFEPVIVDVTFGSPRFDLLALRKSISSKTLAVIAVNFLGVSENLAAVKEEIADRPIHLIEDNAQWFPETASEYKPVGDYATFSFGRGKALSLLGGGLVLSEKEVKTSELQNNSSNELMWLLKVRLLSILTKPIVYRWIEKLPFLNIGSTYFHSLEKICVMPAHLLSRFLGNVQEYTERARTSEYYYRSKLTSNGLHSILDCNASRLLRFPYLFKNKENRDLAYRIANDEGLGVSKMYGESLNCVGGVESLNLNSAVSKNAEDFSHRFMSLPTHNGVTNLDAIRLVEIIREADG